MFYQMFFLSQETLRLHLPVHWFQISNNEIGVLNGANVGNLGHGIHTEKSTKITVTGNEIANNGYYGVYYDMIDVDMEIIN